MTEVGYDRMAVHEIGFHGSLLLFDQRGETTSVGRGYWRPYPFATMLLRDKVLFYQHNLAPETFTDNLPTLRWNLAMGYQLSHGLNPVAGAWVDDPWLYAVSLLQRMLLAPVADVPLTSFRTLEPGVTETRFGDVRDRQLAAHQTLHHCRPYHCARWLLSDKQSGDAHGWGFYNL